jgi:hypothetical protein
MFKPLPLTLALLFGLCAGAVSCDACDEEWPADQVFTRTNPAGNFASYATFAFPDPASDPILKPSREIPEQVKANLAIINERVRQEMLALGFREVQPDQSPDLVAFSLASASKDGAIVWECIPGGWWGYWYWAWDPCAATDPDYVEYAEGVFWVGLSDPALKQVVFAGLAQGYGDGSGSDLEARLDSAMHRIFAEYPQPPKAP